MQIYIVILFSKIEKESIQNEPLSALYLKQFVSYLEHEI